jgi:hypothetical protein
MLDVEQILQLAERHFWKNQLRHDPKYGFEIYNQYHAVADALDEVIPGWKKLGGFLKEFGQYHDLVLASSVNTVFKEAKDWTPSATQIENALSGECQRFQFALSHALTDRISDFSDEIDRRGDAMGRANRSVEAATQ